ncbi:3-deoxy-D-manno-octulosonic acid transferase [Desulfuromonas thiophila]|uniref:3-deoxy-D-manno-octulosonic acid transferase n=1 Tax=Desulfuromonas thiophila TaxID=57664 RepID=A0A1G7BRS8_9BACT|nr:3-deoxy-D-manno-octulosonic acid transferase [Desulfuromonas thiophila]SDE29844.1 3-deoxy-D-manno-octulosonic-acid transferase [Desulfuromonas thiophila]
MYLLYDLLVSLTLLLLAPGYLVLGWLRRKPRQGLAQRLGCFPADHFAALRGRPVIWIHAVSVGETRAAVPLIRHLRQRWPRAALVLSSVTETGHQIAGGIAEVDARLYFPVDSGLVIRRVLDRVQPDLVLIVETELWPQFIRQCHLRRIPLALVNGRISDRSFPRYHAVRRLLRPLLSQIACFCMQSAIDAERIARLGAPAERILTTGNLKFDPAGACLPDQDDAALRVQFGLAPQVRVLVAGSTHEGEEEAVLSAFRQLRQRGHELLLILVPRHPHRCRALADLLDKNGLPWRLRSAAPAEPLGAGAVLLVDSIGEMLHFYALAELVFVGGSLVPVGGHNLLEAALLQKAALHGPHMHNFREIAAWIGQAQGFGLVQDVADLTAQLDHLLRDPERCRRSGTQAWQLLQRHAGASARTLEALQPLLQRRGIDS